MEHPIYVLDSDDLQVVITKIVSDLLAKNEKPAEDRLLTVNQAAKMLGISRTTLWRWSKNKYLVPQRLGNSLRYKESELLKHLDHEA